MKIEVRNQKFEKSSKCESFNTMAVTGQNDQEGGGRSMRLEKPYDLSERCAQFGEAVIYFAKRVPVILVTSPLINQLVKAGTSVGANYEEANDAESKKDFHHKIAISRKESRETKFFLRMIAAASPKMRNDAAVLYQEAKELNLIFGAMKPKKAPDRPRED